MRAWVLMLGGLAVWAAHFFALYGIASVFPGQSHARWWVLAATVPALAAGILILRGTVIRVPDDPFDSWLGKIAMLGAAAALLAIVWQAVPAVLI